MGGPVTVFSSCSSPSETQRSKAKPGRTGGKGNMLSAMAASGEYGARDDAVGKLTEGFLTISEKGR